MWLYFRIKLWGRSALWRCLGSLDGVGQQVEHATALLFAREGARVLAVDRDEEDARSTDQSASARTFTHIASIVASVG